jgi:polyisoprenoid-binding protein YceI
VKASVALEGTFDKWDAAMTFTSPDVTTGVLDIKIQADSVNTGSGMKDGKLKSNDFFDVKQDPLITFHSDKLVQTGPTTLEVPGTFTIREVSTRNADPSLLPGREPAQVRSREQWPSTVRIMG